MRRLVAAIATIVISTWALAAHAGPLAAELMRDMDAAFEDVATSRAGTVAPLAGPLRRALDPKSHRRAARELAEERAMPVFRELLDRLNRLTPLVMPPGTERAWPRSAEYLDWIESSHEIIDMMAATQVALGRESSDEAVQMMGRSASRARPTSIRFFVQYIDRSLASDTFVPKDVPRAKALRERLLRQLTVVEAQVVSGLGSSR